MKPFHGLVFNSYPHVQPEWTGLRCTPHSSHPLPAFKAEQASPLDSIRAQESSSLLQITKAGDASGVLTLPHASGSQVCQGSLV